MKHGKATCKILKEIRREIAAQNNIPLEEHECTYEGDCRGTCPRCEAEVRYLETELQKKSQLGKAVITTGIMLRGMLMSGCHSSTPTSPEAPAPTLSEPILNHNEPTETSDSIPRQGGIFDYDDEGIIETEWVNDRNQDDQVKYLRGEVVTTRYPPELPENDIGEKIQEIGLPGPITITLELPENDSVVSDTLQP
ncbi:MAG: hypothetical protein IJP65_04180 [Bacteroidales bacterium]|nr:hypothetical protein [Bacteroidales bacterium]